MYFFGQGQLRRRCASATQCNLKNVFAWVFFSVTMSGLLKSLKIMRIIKIIFISKFSVLENEFNNLNLENYGSKMMQFATLQCYFST